MNRRQEELLRRLALHDEATLQSLLRDDPADPIATRLDARSRALVRLASMIALPAAAASFEWCVAAAFAAGATDEDVVDVLLAVAPLVGMARVNRAAAGVALAMGLDTGLADGE